MTNHKADLVGGGYEEIALRAAGFHTRCLVAGPEDGEVVLLLHDAAFGGSSDVSWRSTIPVLAKRHRLLVPDLLGFGGSDKAIFFDRSPYDFRIEHVLAVVDALAGNAKVHVIGNSFGGSMGLNMLRRHSDRMRSLISITGAGGGWRTDHGMRVLSAWDGTRDGLAAIVRELAEGNENFDIEAHIDQRLHWARQEGHYRAVMAPSITLPEALASGVKRDPFPPVPKSDVPVLLIAGVRDRLVEPDWPEKLAALLPGPCEIERMDSRHAPNLDHPVAFAAIASNWLQRHSR